MQKFYIACAVALAVALPGAQGKRFITETDLLKFTWLADPQISPDGSTVAFVRVTVNEKENRYESSLFTVATTGGAAPHQLTSGLRDSTPRWAPDSKRLAFVRAVDKDGKTQPAQIYLLPMDGGEARPITDVPRGASSPVWSPDGAAIAFNASTGPEEKKGVEGYKSEVEVVTGAGYRASGHASYL